MIPGLVSAGLGFIFALHGFSNQTATVRWSYGFTYMYDGIKIVPAVVGLFAIGEMLHLLYKNEQIESDSVTITDSPLKGVKDVFRHKLLFLRSSFVGVAIGVVPGAGGAIANFVAYYQAIQTSSDSDEFGTGDVRGVIACEASNDAKDGSSLLPTLGLGIPGSIQMAIILGAFTFHGLTPGPGFLQDHLDIALAMIIALVFSNIITSAVGILLADKLIRVTRIDIHVIAPLIIGISFYSIFILDRVILDLFILMLFGLLGFVMVTINMSRVPMILAMVLTPIVENNFFRAVDIGHGDPLYFVYSPLSIVLLILLLTSLFLPYIKKAGNKYVAP